MSSYYNQGGFLSNIPPVTKNIILINVLMFIATLINQDYMINNFALFYPESPFFKPWQIITHMFMHGGFWHIFFNMYTLLMFGTVLERAIGSKKMLVFYFVAGLGAALLHYSVEYLQIAYYYTKNSIEYINILRTPTLGASGAIYGILIGYAMLYPNAQLMLLFPPIPIKAKWLVIIFIGIELSFGITGTLNSIAHFAHLGGALFGFLLLLYWKKTNKLYDQNSWF